MQRLSQKQIRFIISLRQSKFRNKFNQFLIEGDKICNDVLQLHPTKIHFVCATANWIKMNAQMLNQHEVYSVTDQELKKISSQKTPNQVLMVLEKKSQSQSIDAFNNKLCFYLDQIQDPGNMGTILRVVDWFGLVPLYISPGCVDIYNPKVVQSSMGSILSVSTLSTSFEALVEIRSEHTSFYASKLNGLPVSKVDWAGGGVIVIGNESKGVSEGIIQACDEFITIPKSSRSSLDSLNAAISTGIIASWIRAIVY